ncbi:MAG: hypothetical protein ACRCX2_00750 [Paraclostridium sp.]
MIAKIQTKDGKNTGIFNMPVSFDEVKGIIIYGSLFLKVEEITSIISTEKEYTVTFTSEGNLTIASIKKNRESDDIYSLITEYMLENL